jgi:ubiquinone/menaquinone biosynthesis C-methylase UbiE
MSALATRDETVSEILDGDLGALDRVRPPFSRTTMSEARRRIVDGIGAAERRSGGSVALADVLIRIATERFRSDDNRAAPVRVLEVGAGDGWLLRTFWKRARKQGLPVALGAIDSNPAFIRALQDRFAVEDIPCDARVADARWMPAVASGEWAVAVLSHTLHHFAPSAAVRCLRELDRVSNGGMVVFDVDRSLLGLFSIPVAVTLLAPRAFPYCARDGIASVRRAYSREDLEGLLDDAGLRDRYRVGNLPSRHPQHWITNAITPARP